METTGLVASIVLQIVLAVATIALAIYTARMWRSTSAVANGTLDLAKRTADLARETLDASALADKHHQEAMTPVVILRDTVVFAEPNRFVLNGKIANIGLGIALDTCVWIGKLGEKQHLGPLGPGQERAITTQVTTGRTEQYDYPILVVLLYKNLFGAEAKTEHHGKCGTKDGFNTIFYPPEIVARVQA